MEPLSLRLVGGVGARINVRSSYSQLWPTAARIHWEVITVTSFYHWAIVFSQFFQLSDPLTRFLWYSPELVASGDVGRQAVWPTVNLAYFSAKQLDMAVWEQKESIKKVHNRFLIPSELKRKRFSKLFYDDKYVGLFATIQVCLRISQLQLSHLVWQSAGPRKGFTKQWLWMWESLYAGR